MTTITNFKSLNINEKGIVLELTNNSNHTIFFSEIDRIYLKKYEFSFLEKAVFISLPFVLIPITITYFPLEAIPTISLSMILLLVTKIHLHKWYKIKIGLTDGTLYTKKVSKKMKNNALELINKTKKEKFDYENRLHNCKVSVNCNVNFNSNENEYEKFKISIDSLVID